MILLSTLEKIIFISFKNVSNLSNRYSISFNLNNYYTLY